MALPQINVPKVSFAGGEFEPGLWSRVDLQKWATGARTLRNVIVRPTGGVFNRPGLHYVATAKFDDKAVRMLPFEFSSSQTYALETGDEYIRFYTDNGQIVTTLSDVVAWVTATVYVVGDFVKEAGTIYYCLVAHTAGVFATDLAAVKWVAQSIYEVVTPWAEADLPNLNYAQSADIIFVACGDVAPQMIQREGDVNWSVVDYPFENGPFMPQNTDEDIDLVPSATTGTGINVDASEALFNPLHVGSLWQLRQPISGQIQTTAFASVTSAASIVCGGTWRIITHGTWTGKLLVEKSTDGGTNWFMVRAYTSADDNNVNTFGTEDNPSGNAFLVRMRMSSYTSGTCNADLSTDAFTQVGVFRVATYVSPTEVTADVLTDLGSTEACVDWSEGSWSDYRGWPQAVSFEQNRIVWSGTRSEPSTNWTTKTDNFYDFGRSQPLLDSDGISVPLPSLQLNAVTSLVPLLGLVALTSSGEFTIGEPGTPLSPLTVTTKPNSYYGAAAVRPVIVGTRAIYVQSSGTAIRDLGYSLSANGFEGNLISILSKHLFDGYQITELAYQQDPDSIVWARRSDGALLAMTYLREQEVLAWTKCDTGDGDDLFESMCCIQATGYKQMWFAVQRGTARYIERMDQRMASTALADQFFVDCGISYVGAPATVITGLDHLEGQEVAVLADGVVVANYDDPMTVASGQITLSAAASKVHIGKPIRAQIQTLAIEVPTAGTLLNSQVKLSKFTLQVLQSMGGKYGTDFTTMYPLTQTFLQAYGVDDVLYTGKLKDVLPPNYSEEGVICIEQSDPLPFCLLAVIPQVTIGGVTSLQ
jgi:hypothetical protein